MGPAAERKSPATGRYVYPDASVVCARPEFVDEHRDTLLNPRMIIEVLSDSTEAYDRGDKFAQYRSVASFEEMAVMASHAPLARRRAVRSASINSRLRLN